jgi:hypothetical protein
MVYRSTLILPKVRINAPSPSSARDDGKPPRRGLVDPERLREGSSALISPRNSLILTG